MKRLYQAIIIIMGFSPQDWKLIAQACDIVSILESAADDQPVNIAYKRISRAIKRKLNRMTKGEGA
jgi:c-di-AMP phosphodiesterase-like protein